MHAETLHLDQKEKAAGEISLYKGINIFSYLVQMLPMKTLQESTYLQGRGQNLQKFQIYIDYQIAVPNNFDHTCQILPMQTLQKSTFKAGG